MKNILLFSRLPDGPILKFGQLAEEPLEEGAQQDIRKYIVCRMPEGVCATDLPIPTGSRVFLKLDELQSRYPDETVTYTDEEGSEQERIEHGYYSPHGRSTVRGEVIELSDVWWIDPQGVTHGK